MIYNDTFALKGWKTEEINGIEFELNSILAVSYTHLIEVLHVLDIFRG